MIMLTPAFLLFVCFYQISHQNRSINYPPCPKETDHLLALALTARATTIPLLAVPIRAPVTVITTPTRTVPITIRMTMAPLTMTLAAAPLPIPLQVAALVGPVGRSR